MESVAGGGMALNAAALDMKNPFGFQLAGVIQNTEKTRQAITKEQMKKFLKFVHDDNIYCKYYEIGRAHV